MKGTYKDQKKIEGEEQKNQLINDSIKDSNRNNIEWNKLYKSNFLKLYILFKGFKARYIKKYFKRIK